MLKGTAGKGDLTRGPDLATTGWGAARPSPPRQPAAAPVGGQLPPKGTLGDIGVWSFAWAGSPAQPAAGAAAEVKLQGVYRRWRKLKTCDTVTAWEDVCKAAEYDQFITRQKTFANYCSG